MGPTDHLAHSVPGDGRSPTGAERSQEMRVRLVRCRKITQNVSEQLSKQAACEKWQNS